MGAYETRRVVLDDMQVDGHSIRVEWDDDAGDDGAWQLNGSKGTTVNVTSYDLRRFAELLRVAVERREQETRDAQVPTPGPDPFRED